MNAIGVGLIGLGRHGMRYARHLLAPLPHIRLLAVCRLNVQAGLPFAREHGLRLYHRYQDLIADPDVEAILAVTHPSLNLAIAREAIRHRKPILIEKPLTLTAQEARSLTEQAANAGVPVMTAHTLRYDAAIHKLKELAPALGPWQYLVLTARLERRPHSPREVLAWNGRGALLEIGIHFLDLVQFLTHESVRDLACELGRPAPGEPEERAWVRLTMQSGLPCLLDISRMSGTRATRVEIIGAHGQGLADWSASTVRIHTRQERTTLSLPSSPTIVAVLQAFVHALQVGAPMPITAEDGRRAVELAEACYESAQSSRPVQIIAQD